MSILGRQGCMTMVLSTIVWLALMGILVLWYFMDQEAMRNLFIFGIIATVAWGITFISGGNLAVYGSGQRIYVDRGTSAPEEES